MNWFSLLIKNFGKPIPTWKEAAPSGLPNLTQFSRFYSSVKHSYDLEIIMNFACASGLLGLRSGWNYSANFLSLIKKLPVGFRDLVDSCIWRDSKNFMWVKSDHLSGMCRDKEYKCSCHNNTGNKESQHYPKTKVNLLSF